MAFYGLKNIRKLNIPRSLEKCYRETFYECPKLKELHFNGTPDELIRLFANLDYCYFVGDMDSTEVLHVMCGVYPVCPESFKSEDTGCLDDDFTLYEDSPAFFPFDAIYCGIPCWRER